MQKNENQSKKLIEQRDVSAPKTRQTHAERTNARQDKIWDACMKAKAQRELLATAQEAGTMSSPKHIEPAAPAAPQTAKAAQDRSLDDLSGHTPEEIATILHNDAVTRGQKERFPNCPHGVPADECTAAKAAHTPKQRLKELAQEAAQYRGPISARWTGAEWSREVLRLTTQRDALQRKCEETSARLACVTSAFLVLSNDETITGPARKLIEKEMELMRSGKSGGYMLNKLRETRAKCDQLQASRDAWEQDAKRYATNSDDWKALAERRAQEILQYQDEQTRLVQQIRELLAAGHELSDAIAEACRVTGTDWIGSRTRRAMDTLRAIIIKQEEKQESRRDHLMRLALMKPASIANVELSQ